MNKLYLVSVIGRDVYEYDYRIDFRLFSECDDAKRWLNGKLQDFLNENEGVDFDYKVEDDWSLRFTWNGGGSDMEIRLSELTVH